MCGPIFYSMAHVTSAVPMPVVILRPVTSSHHAADLMSVNQLYQA